MNYAYARVSAKDQNLQRQIAAFCEFGIDKSQKPHFLREEKRQRL